MIVAVYAACVLFPALWRDLLMHLALVGLVQAHWTDRSHDEWTRNLKKLAPILIRPESTERASSWIWQSLRVHR